MSIEIRITCDRCMKVEAQGGWGFQRRGAKPHLLRQRLRKLGWKTALRGGEDFCPQCAAAPKEEP